MKKREKLLAAAIAGILTTSAVLAWSEYERRHFVVTDYTIRSKKVPKDLDGYKMAVIADLHQNRFGKGNIDLIRAVKRKHPDAVIFAGDEMTVKPGKRMDFSALEELLQAFDGVIPMYYAKGNHEARMKAHPQLYYGWYQNFIHLLDRYHVIYLEDEIASIQRGRATLELIGFDLPETYYKKKFGKVELDLAEIEQAVGPVSKEQDHYHVMLAHSPLYAREYAAWGADLAISGHFHGGTIRIPKLGGLMSPQFQFFSGMDRGLYELSKEHYQVTSGGLGTHSINLRLNNISELVMITLKCKQK